MPEASGLPEPTPRLAGYRLSGLQGRLIAELGQRIVAGKLPPGALLPREPELMTAFGVSRTSVREALKVLAAKGLIESRQKVGTRVRPADLWNMFDSDIVAWHHAQGQGEAMLRELIELRQVIEPAAARLAAGRSDLDDLRRLRRALERMAASTGDPRAYADADVEFHLALFAAARNRLLASFAHLVADFLQLSFRLQQAAVGARAGRLEDDVALHRAVFDAVNRGDGEAAANATLQVVLDGKNALLGD